MYSASYETNGIKGKLYEKRYRYKSNTEEYTLIFKIENLRKNMKPMALTINGYHWIEVWKGDKAYLSAV